MESLNAERATELLRQFPQLQGPSQDVTVWCITCGQPMIATQFGEKGPAFGPACPCGKSEGITFTNPQEQ